MVRNQFHVVLVIASTLFLTPSLVGQEPKTHPLFRLDSPVTVDSLANAPFPSDWFTVPDHTQNTHRRVSLPLPDCSVFISDCEDIAVLNELDGFNVQPRLSIPFSGPIDPATVTSGTVFLVSLGTAGFDQDEMPSGTVVGIDQVVWDTFTKTLHVESDALLAQHTRFALIVTRGILDANGLPVGASDAFRHFRANVREDYKQALLDAIEAARRVGVQEEDIVDASVFTTQSATAVLEKIRDQIHGATPDPADFVLGLDGERTVFNWADVTGIIWRQQTQVNPTAFTNVPFDLSLLGHFPGAVGRVAFGKYLSPDYEVHSVSPGEPSEYIPPVGTRSGTPAVQGTNEICFSLFLPSGPQPANGWPVAIVGHGNNGNKDDALLDNASSMAHNGIATIAINAVGHGLGPAGTLTVSRTVGTPVTFASGGRGIDQNRDGIIGSNEGQRTTRPRDIVFFSDGFRQTAVDLMQLVRVIEVGMDVDGDGQRDLDPSRIYYLGNSWGGGYGSVFVPVEPSVRVGVFNVPPDPVPIGNLGPANRILMGTILASRQPSLLNSPGIRVFAGLLIGAPRFNENRPLRQQIPLTVQLTDNSVQIIQSPVINGVAGAMAIQELIERYEWVSQAGSPAAYAPHLRKFPLQGVSAKSVLYQIAKGDRSAPNPTTTAILRAGELADRTTYYRHDLALAEFPNLPGPHTFATNIAFGDIMWGAQDQTGRFFASDGTLIIHPGPAGFFEVPILGPLPEDLNYIP